MSSLFSLLFTCILVLLIAANLSLYIPIRFGGLTGIYGARRAMLAPFTDPKVLAMAPALVIVHDNDNWREYSTLLQLSNPELDSPFIFALSLDPQTDQSLAGLFPGRQVYHYYPARPGQFFLKPLH